MSETEVRRYVRFRGREYGPFGAEELARMAKRGQLTRMHELSEDREQWVRAGSDATLFTPPPEAIPEGAPVPEAAAVSQAGVSARAEQSTLRLGEQAEWHYAVNGAQAGPVTISALRELHAAGKVGRDDLVWRPGMPEWKALSVAGVLAIVNEPPAGKEAAALDAAAMQSAAAAGGRASHAGLALSSMIVSTVGLLSFIGGVVLGPVGVLLGVLAMTGMRRSGNRAGHGFAMAGLSIGAMALIVGVAAIVMGAPGKIAAMFGGTP